MGLLLLAMMACTGSAGSEHGASGSTGSQNSPSNARPGAFEVPIGNMPDDLCEDVLVPGIDFDDWPVSCGSGDGHIYPVFDVTCSDGRRLRVNDYAFNTRTRRLSSRRTQLSCFGAFPAEVAGLSPPWPRIARCRRWGTVSRPACSTAGRRHRR